jgi:hypothetical protein
VRDCVLCCWLSWPLTLLTHSGGRKLTYIMKVATSNLFVQYDHCPGQQTYEKILNNIIKFTSGLWVSLAIPYIAIRIMKNNGSCYGGNKTVSFG